MLSSLRRRAISKQPHLRSRHQFNRVGVVWGNVQRPHSPDTKSWRRKLAVARKEPAKGGNKQTRKRRSNEENTIALLDDCRWRFGLCGVVDTTTSIFIRCSVANISHSNSVETLANADCEPKTMCGRDEGRLKQD